MSIKRKLESEVKQRKEVVQAKEILETQIAKLKEELIKVKGTPADLQILPKDSEFEEDEDSDFVAVFRRKKNSGSKSSSEEEVVGRERCQS